MYLSTLYLTTLVCLYISISAGLLSVASQSTPFPIVNTPLGQVQGITTGTNNTVNAYYGVPYAQSPLGNLRFRYPLPATPWGNSTIFNGTDQTPYPLCIQPNASIGTEDCLRVDVYSPSNATANSKLPVIVVIPGGGYTGITNFSGIINTMSYTSDVIIVFVRYRVNIFGFLASEGLSGEDAASK